MERLHFVGSSAGNRTTVSDCELLTQTRFCGSMMTSNGEAKSFLAILEAAAGEQEELIGGSQSVRGDEAKQDSFAASIGGGLSHLHLNPQRSRAESRTDALAACPIGSWDPPFVHTRKRWLETRDPSIIWEGHKAGREILFCHMEKLCNLEQLPPNGFSVACFPHKIKGGSAGWTRAVALFD